MFSNFINVDLDERHRDVSVKVDGFTYQLILSAVAEVGLTAEEVLECLPGRERMKQTFSVKFTHNNLLFANPCEVFYRAGERAPAVPVWTGKEGVDPNLV
ncbi:hypothetical protein KIN20_011853 [Parelaphostrongylus tenuis]|uniref:Uncharacterized protein n=1 Tax=Parelaphostrongylus tenuis TaxID=148309 RepID=A0AAD5QMC4_PARTN|nr:hypothetical protein KIN20_011853 [Parelaphostrongylus tenuis]